MLWLKKYAVKREKAADNTAGRKLPDKGKNETGKKNAIVIAVDVAVCRIEGLYGSKEARIVIQTVSAADGEVCQIEIKGGQSHTVENIKPGGCNGAEWKNKYKQLWNSMDYLHGQEQKNI